MFTATTAQSLTTTLRPWRDFLDSTSLSLPSSLSDATSRISQNLNHFFLNYALLVLLVLIPSLLYHPLSLFLLLFAAWLFHFFSRFQPGALFGFTIDQRRIVALFGVMTIVALFFTNVWLDVAVLLLVAAVLVSLHAAFRATDDLNQDSPYGALLPDSPKGPYSHV
ncbi:PRA1 family protein D-like [Fagus crenata]